jgi:hypothetical protein
MLSEHVRPAKFFFELDAKFATMMNLIGIRPPSGMVPRDVLDPLQYPLFSGKHSFDRSRVEAQYCAADMARHINGWANAPNWVVEFYRRYAGRVWGGGGRGGGGRGGKVQLAAWQVYPWCATVPFLKPLPAMQRDFWSEVFEGATRKDQQRIAAYMRWRRYEDEYPEEDLGEDSPFDHVDAEA